MRILRQFTFALILVALAAPARAQAVVSADISRLETTAGEIERQITPLERTDPGLAAEAKKTLTDLRDDITYLRVKLRRDGSVSRDDYADVRDRLDSLSRKVRGDQRVYAQTPGAEPPSRFFTVPVGTEMDVRLQTPLDSGTARVEQRFEATTLVDLSQGKDVVIPAGSVVRGFVSSVRPAGKIDRTGSLTLSFDQLVVNERASKLRASVTKALDPKVSEDVSRIGAGAAVGAVIGGILGGGKGALLGVLIGGGGTIASTEGSDVDLPIGTILRIRIDQPVEIGGSSQTSERHDP